MKSTWKMIKLPASDALALMPDDADAIETARATKEGQLFIIDLKVNRNPQHHKLFFALLRFVVEHSPEYRTTDELLFGLKIANKHVDEFIGFDGQLYYKPKSLNFESMGQDAFRKFFDSSVHILCERFEPTLESESLRREFWGFLNQ